MSNPEIPKGYRNILKDINNLNEKQNILKRLKYSTYKKYFINIPMRLTNIQERRQAADPQIVEFTTILNDDDKIDNDTILKYDGNKVVNINTIIEILVPGPAGGGKTTRKSKKQRTSKKQRKSRKYKK
jgi:hypothetical protein